MFTVCTEKYPSEAVLLFLRQNTSGYDLASLQVIHSTWPKLDLREAESEARIMGYAEHTLRLTTQLELIQIGLVSGG